MWRFHPTIKLKEILLLADYGLREEFKNSPVPWHNGIDISIGDNDPVPCFVDDTAIRVSKVNPALPDEGTVVLVDVNNWEYTFAHMDNVQVKEGDLISFGTLLGYQDSKGKSIQENFRPYWQHLHISLRKIDDVNGQPARLWNYGHKYANVDNGLDGFVDPNLQCERVLKRVAEAIAQIEGFTTGKTKVLVENNNPGGLRWSPFQVGKRNGFAVFDSPLNGYKALMWDLEQKAKGNTRTKLNGKSTILEFCRVWAPKEDGNNPFKYAENLVRICGFRSLNDPIGDWLLTELDWVRKYNNYAESKAGIWWASGIGFLLNWAWNKFFKGRH
jgi:hypothetical protein